jgi:predicted DNA-binding protein with PD1-like motif
VISHLKENEMIQIDQLTPKLYAIRVNNEHPILSVLVELCREHGIHAKKVYLKALEEE